MRPDPVSLFYGNNVPPPGGFVPSADRAEISAKGSPSIGPPLHRGSPRKESREILYLSLYIYRSMNSLNSVFLFEKPHFLYNLKI